MRRAPNQTGRRDFPGSALPTRDARFPDVHSGTKFRCKMVCVTYCVYSRVGWGGFVALIGFGKFGNFFSNPDFFPNQNIRELDNR